MEQGCIGRLQFFGSELTVLAAGYARLLLVVGCSLRVVFFSNLSQHAQNADKTSGMPAFSRRTCRSFDIRPFQNIPLYKAPNLWERLPAASSGEQLPASIHQGETPFPQVSPRTGTVPLCNGGLRGIAQLHPYLMVFYK